MKVITITALSLALTGCAGFNYAIKNYGGVHTRYFTASNGALYRIFDKPEESRLMITPSLQNSAIHGVVRDATFGLARPMSADAPFRQAATEFLQSTGRTCSVVSIEVVFDPQSEVRYQCSSTPDRQD